MDTKIAWTSKTLWFNVLALICAVAVAFGYQGELPEEWKTWVTVIVTIINIILRFITKQPVALKTK